MTDLIVNINKTIHAPTEKVFDAAARIQGFKQRLGWSFHSTPRTLGSLDPKPSALAEGS